MAQEGSIEIAIVADDSEFRSTLETLGEAASAALAGVNISAPEALFAGILDALASLESAAISAGTGAGAGFAAGLSSGEAAASAAAASMAQGAANALTTGADAARTAGMSAGAGYGAGLLSGAGSVTAAAVSLTANAALAAAGQSGAFQTAGLTLGAALAEGIASSSTQASDAAAQVMQGTVSTAQSYRGALQTVGANLVSGMVAGIRAQAGNAATALGAVVAAAIANAKAVAGIHSPSRVMRDEVGHMLGLGMALGITRSRGEVLGAMTLLSEAAIESARQDATSYQDIGSAYAENLSYGLKQGMEAAVTEFSTYVDDLFAAYQNENGKLEGAHKEAAELLVSTYKETLSVGYDEALALIKTRVSELAAVYQAQYDSILSAQKAMEKQLKASSDLFSFDKDGMLVEDVDASIAAIERYQAALDALKARGAGDEFLGEITALSMQEGTEAAEYLLSLTDEAFTSLEEKWLVKQALARDVATAFYADQLSALDEGFNRELTDVLADVPDALTHIGADAMQGWIDGMNGKMGELNDAVRSIASEMLATLRQSLDIHSPSRKTAALVGAPAAQGIGVGFLSAMDEVYATMRGAVDTGMAHLGERTSPVAVQPAAQTTERIIERETSETVSKIGIDDSSLSGFARELLKVLSIEQQKIGKSIIKGG